MGSFSNWLGMIDIACDSDLHPQARQEVLLHEIVEAINHYHEYKLSHNVISSLSENLFQVLNDNGIWDRDFDLQQIVDRKEVDDA
jgi:hypothetical protein